MKDTIKVKETLIKSPDEDIHSESRKRKIQKPSSLPTSRPRSENQEERSERVRRPEDTFPPKNSFQQPLYIKDPNWIEDFFMTEIWNEAISPVIILRTLLVIILFLVGIVCGVVKLPNSFYELFTFMYIAILGTAFYGLLKLVKSCFMTSRKKYRMRLRLIGSDEYFNRYISDCAGRYNCIPDESGLPFEQVARDIQAMRLKEALRLIKPEGPIGNKPSRREIRVNIGKIVGSDDLGPEIPISAKRPHVSISLDKEMPVIALLDSGANSCLISKQYLKELETKRRYRFPRMRTGMKVIGLNSTEKNAEVVLISVNIDNKLPIRDVPFIVCEMDKEVIIGLSLIRTCKISLNWKHEKSVYLTFNSNSVKGRLRVYDDDDSSIKAVNCHKVTIRPGEILSVTMEVPEEQRHLLRGLDQRRVRLKTSDDFTDESSQGIQLIESSTKMKRSKVQGCVINTTDNILELNEGVPLGEIKLEEAQEIGDKFHVSEIIRSNKQYKTMSWIKPTNCICERDLKGDIIHLTDEFGFSPLRISPLDASMNLLDPSRDPFDQLTHGISIRESHKDPSKVVISLIPNEFGDYVYDTASLRCLENQLRNETQYLLLKQKDINQDLILLIFRLKRHCKKLQLVDISDLKKENLHLECLSLGTYFPKEMKENIKSGIILLELDDNVSAHPAINENCTPIIYEILGNKICIYKSGQELVVLCHFNPFFRMNHTFNTERFLYLLVKELRLAGIRTPFRILTNHSRNENPITLSKREKGLTKTLERLEINLVEESFKDVKTDSSEEYLTTRKIPFKHVLPLKDCLCKICTETVAEGNNQQDYLLLGTISIQCPVTIKCNNTKTLEDIVEVEDESAPDKEELEIACVQEDPGKITDLKPGELGLPGYPVCMDPSDKDDKIVREWKAHVKIDEIPSEVRENFTKLLDKHTDLYAYDKLDYKFILDGEEEAKFDLDLTVDYPIFTKPFPLSGPMLKILEQKIDELLEAKMIKMVDSQYNSPLFLVPHNSAQKLLPPEERRYRIVVDLRVINSVVRNAERYSSLVKGVETSLERLRGKKYFTTLDMNSAYRSVKATEKAMQICAFQIPNSIKYPYQSFAFTSLIDGICTGVNIYSYYLQKALSPESRKCSLNHVDDLCIFSDTLEQHLKDIETVFRDLSNQGL